MTADAQHRLDPGSAGKSAMLSVSLHIERLAELAQGQRHRTQLIALFQHVEYFERARKRFTALAEDIDIVVAFEGTTALPRNVVHVELSPGEPLTAEWSLLVMSSQVGAGLITTQTGRVHPARTIERGRAYAYEVTHRGRRIEFHARRLLDAFGARVAPARRGQLLETAAIVPRSSNLPADMPAHDVVDRAIGATDRVTTGRVPAGLAGHPLDGSLAALHAYVADAGPHAPMLGALALRADGRGLRGARRIAASLRGTLPPGALLASATSDVLVVVLPGTVGRDLDTAAAAVTAHLHADGPACSAVVGVLDPRALHVSALLLAFVRTPAGGSLRIPA